MLSEKKELESKQKFLVLSLPGIGDGLMATPLIRLLKKKFPDSQIDVAVMFEASRYIFLHNSFVKSIYKLALFPKLTLNALKTIWDLRKNHYDVSILAFPAYRREYHIIHWLIGARQKIAHRFKSGYWSECNFLENVLIPVDENLHNVENNLNLLQALQIDWHKELKEESIRYDLELTPEDLDFGKNYIQKLNWPAEKIIAIHPGSTNSRAALLRRWPVEHYAQLASELIKEKNCQILIFSGPDEKELARDLEKQVNDLGHCHLVETASFGQALGILKEVNLLVCNDNGFGHLAVALGKKIVTLWASTNNQWSLPYDNNLVKLIRPEDFKAWYTYNLKTSLPAGVEGGMNKISVQQVKDIVWQQI